MALLGDGAEVERVLEQIACEAVSARPDGLSEQAWLLGLVRTACATRLSAIPLRTGRIENSAPRTLRLGSEAPSAARNALTRLKPTEREAVVLHLVGGLDCSEIATICRLDTDVVKTRIARGIEQLMTDGSEGGAR